MDPNDPAMRRRMWQELDAGWATTIELMTAVGVWMGIGWLLDLWLGSWPWLMVTGATLGFGLGVYMAYLNHQQRLAETAPERFRPSAEDVDPRT